MFSLVFGCSVFLQETARRHQKNKNVVLMLKLIIERARHFDYDQLAEREELKSIPKKKKKKQGGEEKHALPDRHQLREREDKRHYYYGGSCQT